MSLPARPVVILPGKRPPPPVPPDVEEIVRVLNGEPPKVCPACGRSWRPDAPCVCLEPEPVASWWARLWRALSAPWAAPEPRLIYEDEVPRPQPMPRPQRGQDFTGLNRAIADLPRPAEFPTAHDFAELTRLIGEACDSARKVKDP